jgi:FAD/FMN-containing dehydrogenase
MWPEFYDVVTTPPAMGRPVLVGRHAYYVLIESLGGDDEGDANRFERVLGEALEAGIVEDATIAKSQAERDRMWALRDDAGQTVRELPIAAFDVSLGLSDMEAFVAAARRDLAVRWPDIHLTVFGHVADGNLHLIVALRDRQRRHDVEDLIYGLVRDRGGSVSAEHGIGLQKRAYLSWTRNDNEIALMRTLKRALDPSGILNPGKIFDQGQPG